MSKPLVIELVLGGQAKSLEPLNLHGIYHLQDEHVNNYPYWYQINGSHAIWFFDSTRRWYLGPKQYLGGQHYDINLIGPRGIDKAPTQIRKGWKYWHNAWKDAADSEIIFQDLSPSKLQYLVHNKESNSQHKVFSFQWMLTLVK